MLMNQEYEKSVGFNIKELRLRSGLTQDELSAKMQIMNCDVTRSALAKIEVGQRHIYIDELKVIKEILKVSFEDIII